MNIEMHLFDVFSALLIPGIMIVLCSLITWVTQLRACDSGLAVTNETLRPSFGVRCKYLKRSPEPSGEGQNYKERRDEVCGGLGRDKEALLCWPLAALPICPGSPGPCLCAPHTMTAHSPRSPLHLPPARPMHCSAFFRQSLHQQGCGPAPAGLPRHIIFAFFFTLISIQRLC